MTISDAEAPVLDTAYLDDMRGWIGDETLASLLTSAPEAFHAELARLTAYWQAGDLCQVRETGHRIKGAAASVACRRLSALGHRAQMIETLDDASILAAIGHGIETAAAALAEYRAGLTTPV